MPGKILYLTVADYPYGFGEPFLEDELKIISDSFDEVHILVTEHNNTQQKNSTPKLFVPSNAHIHILNTHINFYEKILGRENFTIKMYWEAYQVLKNNLRQPLTFYKFKVISSYLKKAQKYFRSVIPIVSRTSQEGDIRLFYSYWLTEYTLGNIYLKKRFSDSYAVSRAHGWDVYFERNRESYLPFRKYFIQNLDALFFISEHGKEYLAEKFLHNNPINLYTSRLGTHKIEAFSINLPYDSDTISILTLSFIVPVKRLDLAVAAIENVLEHGIKVRWTHIGGGSDILEHSFKESVSILGKKFKNLSFDFKGLQSKEAIKHILESSYFDILLNTSDYEGLPVSMMEAMSAGIPCIGRNVGGIREIINDGQNGFLCPATASSRDIAEAILRYVRLSHEEKQKFHQNAYNTWNEKFNSEKNYSHFANSLQYIIDPSKKFYECKNCLYSTTNCSEVNIDFNGICNFCRTYKIRKQQIDKNRCSGKLEEIVRLLNNHQGRYNCVIGVSGGVDSTYTAYVAKKILGLKPLAVHLDNGWNSEIAVQNIHRCLDRLEIDLYTHVIDWEEFKDLQLSYLKASVVDIEVLTDHAILATLYKAAIKFKVPYILSGENFTTEGVLPDSWVYAKNDLLNIKAIHKRFGNRRIRTFPTLGYVKKYILDKIYGIKYIPLLDYYPYNKSEAKKIIERELGWKDYGGKHYESTFTKIYQTIILPEKFGIDKRISHFSTLICAGQISREHASEQIHKPILETEERRHLVRFACEKFHISETEWDQLMSLPPVPHDAYPSVKNRIKKMKALLSEND